LIESNSIAEITAEVDAALLRERARWSPVNPQISYYERLVETASHDQNALRRLYGHIHWAGSFAGL
jgi:hypothetical protein